MKDKIKKHRRRQAIWEKFSNFLFPVAGIAFAGVILMTFLHIGIPDIDNVLFDLIFGKPYTYPLPLAVYCFVIPLAIAITGLTAAFVSRGSPLKSEYLNTLEDLLEENPDAVTIGYPVFEGAYSRNPNAWALHDCYVQRVEDKTICVFEWKDYKKYRAMRKQIEAETMRAEINDELQRVRRLRKQFAQSPAQYLEASEEPIELEFEPAQKEYALLQQDVNAYKKSMFYEKVMDDYNAGQKL